MLTDEQIQFFKDNGYLVVKDFYSKELIEEYKLAVEEARSMDNGNSFVHNKGGAYSSYEQKVNLWKDFPKIKELTTDPKRAALAQQLMGSQAVRLFHDHYLIKAAFDSQPSAWHQDHPAWPMTEQRMINCWIPLQDVSISNGTIAYVPQSHLWGTLKFTPSPDSEQITVKGRDARVVTVPIEAGSFIFHDGMTLHYAYPNKSDQPRYAVTVICFPEDLTYNGKSHPVTDNLQMIKGQQFDNEAMFPVLYRV